MGASVYSGYVSAFILFYFLKAELGYCKPRVLLSFLDCFLHFGAERGNLRLLWDWQVSYNHVAWLFFLLNSLSWLCQCWGGASGRIWQIVLPGWSKRASVKLRISPMVWEEKIAHTDRNTRQKSACPHHNCIFFFILPPGYLAPRNLPSAGFFPFLQTVLCDSDARCKGTPYTPEDLLPRLNDISSLRL